MRKFNKLYIFILGILCFTISQILLRIPILNNISSNYNFYVFQLTYPILHSLLLAFSAGVFEEGFRFIFRKYLIKRNYSKSNAIIFGLGHGLIEVVYLIVIIVVSGANISVSDAFIGGYERILAVIFHIGMTVLIWRGFIINKEKISLILAILCHGLFNSVPIVVSIFGGGIIPIEILFSLIILIVLIYIKKVDYNS